LFEWRAFNGIDMHDMHPASYGTDYWCDGIYELQKNTAEAYAPYTCRLDCTDLLLSVYD
jgi:hypothetical protein